MSVFTASDVTDVRRAVRDELARLRAQWEATILQRWGDAFPLRTARKGEDGWEDWFAPLYAATMGTGHRLKSTGLHDSAGGTVAVWSRDGYPIEDVWGGDPTGFAECVDLFGRATQAAQILAEWRIGEGFDLPAQLRHDLMVALDLGPESEDLLTSGPADDVAESASTYADDYVTSALADDWRAWVDEMADDDETGTPWPILFADVDALAGPAPMVTSGPQDAPQASPGPAPAPIPCRAPEANLSHYDRPLDAIEAAHELARRSANRRGKREHGAAYVPVQSRCRAAHEAYADELRAVILAGTPAPTERESA